MFHIRTTKTASGAIAVQVVRYQNRKTIVASHIGSTHNLEKVNQLKQAGLQWIEKTTGQKSLFTPEKEKSTDIVVVNKLKYLGTRNTFIYEVLSLMFNVFSFQKLKSKLLLDLVLMRIIEPVSKLESLELLEEMFGIFYKKGSVYQSIASLYTLKNEVEKQVVAFAKKHLNFNFSIVFYDVTTLYFESFTEDEDKISREGVIELKGFRKNGFSKDNKFNQPQIVIGLIVNGDGFPVSYEVFSGNTFEGKTFIPAITRFKDNYGVKTLTVVADAAMISLENVQLLIKENLSYIVGARMANLKPEQVEEISKELTGKRQDLQYPDLVELVKRDGDSMRIETERGLLVCDFSLKRYRKDKREMEKQIIKAEILLEKKEGMKRTKFLMSKDKKKIEQILNTGLVEKTKLLLGVKGYYTNLIEETNKIIIDHYHNLWHVEKAFRISKSDLKMRPIYHFKEQTIKAHVLICFMALAVAKCMELKTGKSTKRIVKLLRSITDARILNTLTGEEIVLRKEMNEEIKELWKTLMVSY